METITFALVSIAVIATVRRSPRPRVIALWAVSVAVALLVFAHHVTTPLNLNF